ncbi:aspartate--tRNA(Asn) ligase [candidate division WWE3 bacterium]|nr:aspartate--tRNA(Asn) ligase [candidate division WWE3 bacterium]
MKRTYIKDVKAKVGETVCIKGFVHTIRDQGKIKFMVIRDITGFCQVVVLKSVESVFEAVAGLSIESVISVEGLAKDVPQAPGGFEIEAISLEILSLATPELPIPVVSDKGGDETDITLRLDWRQLDLRRPERKTIFRVWTALEQGFREYFATNGYFQLYSPAFMNTASESGAEVFEVSYFEKKAYLAQSPQFYKQMAMSAGFEKIFMVGPVFRAEPSYTTRHMTEFTGWDFEFSYVESHEDVMRELEDVFISGFKKVKEDVGIAIEIPSKPFPKMTMTEVKVKLAAIGIKSEKEFDINPEEEREICRLVKEETGSDFLFVTDYSKEIRPFYHMRQGKDNKLTKSFDLLYKGLEVVTGAQREHRYDVLVEQAKDKGMDITSLEDYLNFFKYGCPPHGGVGIGPGRIVMKILDLPSVKEATFLPRDVKRLRP